MSHVNRFLFKNGVILHAADAPPVATFLQTNPGAYTTTRTHNNGSGFLFWERHMRRLSNSFMLLLKESPYLLFEEAENLTSPFRELSNRSLMWDTVIPCLVNDSIRKVVSYVVEERKFGEELAITALVSGHSENLCHLESGFDEARIAKSLDVYLHIGGYVQPVFGVRENAAHLALVGQGRDFAYAKYSAWVRLRKHLERLRPPSVTELLLSNDGEHILEGCLTNFFVVCLKDKEGDNDTVEQNELQSLSCLEVQTAPLSDGVLPGVIREVIIGICLKIGIPFREVAPSWSKRELWVEAFITNGLRLIQHVETIQAPNSWTSVESNTWEEISWVEKRFEDGPGRITSILQHEILIAASVEALPIT